MMNPEFDPDEDLLVRTAAVLRSADIFDPKTALVIAALDQISDFFEASGDVQRGRSVTPGAYQTASDQLQWTGYPETTTVEAAIAALCVLARDPVNRAFLKPPAS